VLRRKKGWRQHARRRSDALLQGSTLALRRIGRYGLALLDGHSDFRHVGNSAGVGAAAGDDLALVTERGQSDLTDLDGLRPYLRNVDLSVLGIRDDDECREDLAALTIQLAVADDIRRDAKAVGREALTRLDVGSGGRRGSSSPVRGTTSP
jgi:arginase